MEEKRPVWYQLIQFWVKKKGRVGLTIPYLIGAETLFYKKFKPDSVSAFLLKVRDSGLNKSVAFKRCENIGDYVFCLNEQKSYMGTEIYNKEKTQVAFVVTISAEIFGRDFQTLSTNLDKKYRQYIESGKFSLNNGDWTKFSSQDFDIIYEAFNKS